jgi:methylmalonyl-CoA mutase N-terminal domain/subunit
VIAHETGAALVADPLGGSHYVEWMTDEMERQAEEIFAHLDEVGEGSILEGCFRCIDNGWFMGEIAEASWQLEKKTNSGRRLVVGVNAFTDGDEGRPPILSVPSTAEELQRKRLAEVKKGRNEDAVRDALAAVKAAAEEPTTNTMPSILEAVKAYATEGEIMATMGEVFGPYRETAVL